VADLDYALPPRVRRDLALRAGVEITAESVTLSGRCARCATSSGRSRGARA
jgi:hypothetical protein